MKILIITYDFLPDTIGAGMVAYLYANHLTELGYDVSVLSKEYSNPVKNTKFHYLQVGNSKLGGHFWLYDWGKYLKNMNLDQYDTIILNQSNLPVVFGKYFGLSVLSKIIVLIQGLEVEWLYRNKKMSSAFIHSIFRFEYYHRKCLLNCRKIVSVSEFHKQKVITAANLECIKDKFEVVYTGIEKNLFYSTMSSFRKENDLENKEILVSVSRMVKQKGYLEMFSVFKRVVKRDSSFRWVIIGDGSYLEEFKREVQTDRLSEYVIFIGGKTREELKYYYSMSDCFWLLSNYDECLPLVYLEAQACGIPAIGRNKGGTRETIRNNKTGFLVDTEEECVELILNRSYKNISKKAIKEFVDLFDEWEAAKKLIS